MKRPSLKEGGLFRICQEILKIYSNTKNGRTRGVRPFEKCSLYMDIFLTAVFIV